MRNLPAPSERGNEGFGSHWERIGAGIGPDDAFRKWAEARRRKYEALGIVPGEDPESCETCGGTAHVKFKQKGWCFTHKEDCIEEMRKARRRVM